MRKKGFLLTMLALLSQIGYAADADVLQNDPQRFDKIQQEIIKEAQSVVDKAPEEAKKKSTPMLSEQKELLLSTLPQTTQDAEVLYKQGLEAFQKGDYQTALQFFEKSTELDPTNTQLILLTAKSYSALGKYEKSIQLLDAALAIHPDFIPALIERARAQIAIESFVKAKEDVDLLLQHSSKLPAGLIKELKSISAALAPERKHSVNLIFSFNTTLDSNSVAGFDHEVINQQLLDLGGGAGLGPTEVVEPTAKSDKIFNSNAILSHSVPLERSEFTWRNLGLISRGDNARVKTSNMILGLYSTTLAYKKGRNGIDSTLTFSRLELDNELSQMNKALQIKYSFYMNKVWTFSASAQGTLKRYYTQASKNDYYSPTEGSLVSYELGFNYKPTAKHLFDGTISRSEDRKPGTNSTPLSKTVFHSYVGSANYTFSINSDWTLKTGIVWKVDKYDTPDLALTKLFRKDDSYQLKAGVTYKVPLKSEAIKALTLNLNASYKKNHSNSPLNCYNSKQLTFGATIVF